MNDTMGQVWNDDRVKQLERDLRMKAEAYEFRGDCLDAAQQRIAELEQQVTATRTRLRTTEAILASTERRLEGVLDQSIANALRVEQLEQQLAWWENEHAAMKGGSDE
jgi:septal ring factor EnvC (AmiA/AmiB activator)